MRFTLIAIVLSLGIVGCSNSHAPTPDNDKLQHQAALYTPPKPEHWTLSNGLSIYFLEDKELPLLSGTLYVRGGSIWENENEVGVLAAMGDQMRQGGAGSRSADELDTYLQTLAAEVGSGFGQEFGKISFAGLSANKEEILNVFSDVVLNPRFERDRLLLWKGQAIEAIRRRADDPNTVAALAFQQLIYGPTTYGRVLSEQDVNKIETQALVDAHTKWVQPKGALMAVTGNITRAELEKMLEERFSIWKPSPADPPPAPPVAFEPHPGIYFIEQPLAQSTVIMGQLGIARHPPDNFAIDIFNSIFGSGSFSSLLMRRVRAELGLAYGVYGFIATAVVKGKNTIQVQTKSASTALAIEESLKVLVEMKTTPVSERELNEAKQRTENSFVFNFDTPEKVLARKASLELLDYPKDFDETYIAGILGLGPEDIKQVAQNRWDLSKFVFVVVGDRSAYDSLKAWSESPDSETHQALNEVKKLPIRKVSFDQKLVL